MGDLNPSTSGKIPASDFVRKQTAGTHDREGRGEMKRKKRNVQKFYKGGPRLPRFPPVGKYLFVDIGEKYPIEPFDDIS